MPSAAERPVACGFCTHVIARVSRVACIATSADAQPLCSRAGNRLAIMRSGKLITRLDRYMFRQLLLALVAVTGGLTALVWLIQSLRFVELVVNHGLSVRRLCRAHRPADPELRGGDPADHHFCRGAVHLPAARGRPRDHCDAGGRPVAVRAVAPALALAVLAVACGYALKLWIVPASLTAFRQFQWEIRNRMAAFLLQEGVFTQVNDDLTVYVRSRDPDGTLRGILVDDGRDKSAHATILAESGRLVEGPNGPRVLLVNGSRQEIDHQTGRLNVLTFGQNEIDLADNQASADERLRDMSEVSLGELLDPHPPRRTRHRQVDRRGAQAAGNAAERRVLHADRAVRGAQRDVSPTRQHGHARWRRSARWWCCWRPVLPWKTSLRATMRMLPLMWLQAVAPGVICGWMLFGPQWPQSQPPCCRGRPERMTRPITLVDLYRHASSAGAVIGMLLALSGLVALFDFIELLRRSISRAGCDLHAWWARSPRCACPILPCRCCRSRCCSAACCASGG